MSSQVTYKKSTLPDVLVFFLLCGVEESRDFIGQDVFTGRADGFHRQTFRAELPENLVSPDGLIRKVKYSFQPVNLLAAQPLMKLVQEREWKFIDWNMPLCEHKTLIIILAINVSSDKPKSMALIFFILSVLDY